MLYNPISFLIFQSSPATTQGCQDVKHDVVRFNSFHFFSLQYRLDKYSSKFPLIITSHQQSCGKVTFSQVFVCSRWGVGRYLSTYPSPNGSKREVRILPEYILVIMNIFVVTKCLQIYILLNFICLFLLSKYNFEK